MHCWGEITCTPVPWKQGFRHPTRFGQIVELWISQKLIVFTIFNNTKKIESLHVCILSYVRISRENFAMFKFVIQNGSRESEMTWSLHNFTWIMLSIQFLWTLIKPTVLPQDRGWSWEKTWKTINTIFYICKDMSQNCMLIYFLLDGIIRWILSDRLGSTSSMIHHPATKVTNSISYGLSMMLSWF